MSLSTRSVLRATVCTLNPLVLVMLVVGCGDPLASGDYLGEPLQTLTGVLIIVEDPMDDDALEETDATPILIGIHWMASDGASVSTSAAATSISTSVTRALLPARFALELYEPPGAVPDPALLGWVFAYEDINNSGQFERGVDRVRGTAAEHGVLYDLQRGYQSVEVEDGDCGIEEYGESESENVQLRLYMGNQMPTFKDINCDGDLSEWSGIYP